MKKDIEIMEEIDRLYELTDDDYMQAIKSLEWVLEPSTFGSNKTLN